MKSLRNDYKTKKEKKKKVKRKKVGVWLVSKHRLPMKKWELFHWISSLTDAVVQRQNPTNTNPIKFKNFDFCLAIPTLSWHCLPLLAPLFLFFLPFPLSSSFFCQTFCHTRYGHRVLFPLILNFCRRRRRRWGCSFVDFFPQFHEIVAFVGHGWSGNGA